LHIFHVLLFILNYYNTHTVQHLHKSIILDNYIAQPKRQSQRHPVIFNILIINFTKGASLSYNQFKLTYLGVQGQMKHTIHCYIHFMVHYTVQFAKTLTS